ncbi:MAG TPA: hypothetical protein VMR34_01215 [Candidatus Saccharimonadales bacterium]|nr:hypothetical protein [Candidatus Saccharimonadales bacterium]
MGKSFRKILVFVLPVVILSIFTSLPAWAANNPKNVLTIGPAIISKTFNPGSINTGSISVKNQGQVGYSYSVYAEPYSVIGENYTADFSPIAGAPNPASWLNFDNTKGYLNPGSSTTISYTLTIPKLASSGDYNAVAFVEAIPPSPSAVNKTIGINQRLGEIFYIDVAGPVIQKGRVSSWGANFFQSPPLSSVLRLENDGGAQYTSNIQVNFYDLFGSPKYVYYGHYVVFPHTIRRITVSWPYTPFIGLFRVNGSSTIYGSSQLSTKYVLVVSLTTRIVFGVIVAVLIALTILRAIIRRSISTAKHVSKSKHKTKSK